ncbi:MAG: DUF494 family protein [Candidatus Riflebacteria bacterium]|nr:DUF494 family protein [Candidatus Riflebacteria bacterium]
MNKARSSVGNIVRIMKLVVQHMEVKGDEPSSGLPLMQKLMKRGFTPEDVSQALRWLALLGVNTGTNDEMESCSGHDGRNAPDRRSSSGLRQLHISESIRLDGDSQRLLLEQLETGKVTQIQFEQVIQYLWQNDLRDVHPVRLEILLDMSSSQQPQKHKKPLMLSEKLPPPAFLN